MLRLCLPLALAALASCGSPEPKPKLTQNTTGPDELNNLVEATKHHPSLTANSNQAGAPVIVDPYPRPKGVEGTAHDGHDHDHSSPNRNEP